MESGQIWAQNSYPFHMLRLGRQGTRRRWAGDYGLIKTEIGSDSSCHLGMRGKGEMIWTVSQASGRSLVRGYQGRDQVSVGGPYSLGLLKEPGEARGAGKSLWEEETVWSLSDGEWGGKDRQ